MDPITKVIVMDEFRSLGGAEIILLRVLRGLSNAGTDRHLPRNNRRHYVFHAILPGDGSCSRQMDDLNIPQTYIDISGFKKQWLNPIVRRHVLSQLRNVIIHVQPGLILVNSVWVLFVTGRLAAELGIPVICAVHAAISPKKRLKRVLFPWIGKFFLSIPRRWITVSEHLREELVCLGIPEARIDLIPNGVDVAQDVVSQEDDKTGMCDAIPDSKIRVGVIGRLHPGKGQDVVIAAAAQVVARFPGIYFLIMGEEVPAPNESFSYTRKLEQMIANHGLERNVCLTGFIADIIPMIRSLDIVVSGSFEESFGLAVLEAMACSKAVVATRVPGHENLLQDGVEGYLVPVGDSDRMAVCIEELARDDALRRQMGERGCQTARKFGSRMMIERWDETLDRVLREWA